MADVFVSIDDPRQSAKVEHDLVELLVVAVNALLVGADTFVEIELWAREQRRWETDRSWALAERPVGVCNTRIRQREREPPPADPHFGGAEGGP